ncbi:hypothetical protein ANCCAN_21805 [Ancylostoma caninum]|uniref:Uncharacterized protein n=1 Tax=Ancylostoma caninum TaxID=29170 RepID=A0A368FLH3_ANCCA|nr:hypothetical protein ANCCAN_21805 [Ancylostoma caninum]
MIPAIETIVDEVERRTEEVRGIVGAFPGGFGMGYNMLNSPYGYGSYYDYRCRNLLNGYGYNPLFSGMLGKK